MTNSKDCCAGEPLTSSVCEKCGCYECGNGSYTCPKHYLQIRDGQLPQYVMWRALKAVLPALRWGMTHQPGNMSQWVEIEAKVLAAIEVSGYKE